MRSSIGALLQGDSTPTIPAERVEVRQRLGVADRDPLGSRAAVPLCFVVALGYRRPQLPPPMCPEATRTGRSEALEDVFRREADPMQL
jgi:hypothetical protein